MQRQEDNISDQENENLSSQAMNSMGEPESAAEEVNSETHKKEPAEELPAYAKERLGRQEKRHKRELREQQMQHMQLMQQMQSQQSGFANAGQPQSGSQDQDGGMDDQIQRAVHAALRAKDDQENQRKEAEKAAHVHKQYQNLQDHLDNTADKYDDFDEVVRGNDAPFTPAMRDASLLLDNAGEVLYKLGKDRNKLAEIAKLHPLDQAKEMVKLSVALMGANGKGGSAPRPIGQIKNTPVSPSQINDNTPASEIRARMKAGNFK
jgi:hypothetical protein